MKPTLLGILMILGIPCSYAQQNVGFVENIVSPVISNDGSVTFKLNAPAAKTVNVYGDWESVTGEMKKDDDDIWTYTIEKLPSDLYMYTFSVDGVRLLDPSNAFSYRDVGNLFSLFLVKGGNGDYYSTKNVAHGNVTNTWYPSAQFKTDRRLTVYTPPGYENNNAKYPVLYLLHGSGGDEEAWITLGRVQPIMDNLIAEGRIVPMIVVMPNGNPGKQAAPGETSENFSYRPVMSQFLPDFRQGTYEMAFDEIVKFIDSRFRTKAEKSQRAIAGLSMGGYHSILISANHPDLFDYIGTFSPGVPTNNPDVEWSAYQNLDTKFTVQKNKGYKLYWISIGDKDFLYEPVTNFRKWLDNLQFPYVYVESGRGHIWSNWRKYLVQFTPLLFME